MELNKEQIMLIEDMSRQLPDIRREMGLSQTEFGDLVGLSRQTISAIERGTQPLSWKNYLAIKMVMSEKIK